MGGYSPGIIATFRIPYGVQNIDRKLQIWDTATFPHVGREEKVSDGDHFFGLDLHRGSRLKGLGRNLPDQYITIQGLGKRSVAQLGPELNRIGCMAEYKDQYGGFPPNGS